ncbi:hypothetical protein D3C72_2030760 [compost metagenome]
MLRGVVGGDEGFECGHMVGNGHQRLAAHDKLQQRVEYLAQLGHEILDIAIETAVILGDHADDQGIGSARLANVGQEIGLGAVKQDEAGKVHGTDIGEGGIDLRLVFLQCRGDGDRIGAG